MQPPAKDTYPITYYVSQNEASVSQRKKKKRNVCPYRAGLFFNDVLRRNSSGEWVCAPVKGRLAKHPVVLEAQRFTLREANLDAEHIAEVACALYPQMLALQVKNQVVCVLFQNAERVWQGTERWRVHGRHQCQRGLSKDNALLAQRDACCAVAVFHSLC